MKVRLLFVALVVVVIGYTASPAHGGPMLGEAPPGASKTLGGTGIPVSWSNPNTVLYTCNNPNGFVILHVVPRNPNGLQPVSYSLNVSTGGASTSFTTASSLINNVFGVVSSQVVTGTMGQSIVVTPLTTTTGSIVMDLVGFEGS